MKRFFALCLLAAAVSCTDNDKTKQEDGGTPPVVSTTPPPANLSFSIVSEFPHDTAAYTQGLELHNGKMYEGTGDFENSTLRITNHKTGKVEQNHPMGTKDIFGEGITIFNGKLYQLTWESNIVYEYDVNNINKPIRTFHWPYEGWGLTNNGTDLIVSDGTSNIYFVSPDSFTVRRSISVSTDKGPVDNINELEYVNGFIYANIYMSNIIVKIDPATGNIVGRLDFPASMQEAEKAKNPRTDVLNGIAYDSTSKSFFITGKRWSRMFEVKIN
jgi:glutaminyl-peptide cyclotransferase